MENKEYTHTGFIIENYYELGEEIKKYTEINYKWEMRNSFAIFHKNEFLPRRFGIMTNKSGLIYDIYIKSQNIVKGTVTKIFKLRENSSSQIFIGICVEIPTLGKFYTTVYDKGNISLQNNKHIMIYSENCQREMKKDDVNKTVPVNFEVKLKAYIL
jgi:hypothetical protein